MYDCSLVYLLLMYSFFKNYIPAHSLEKFPTTPIIRNFFPDMIILKTALK